MQPADNNQADALCSAEWTPSVITLTCLQVSVPPVNMRGSPHLDAVDHSLHCAFLKLRVPYGYYACSNPTWTSHNGSQTSRTVSLGRIIQPDAWPLQLTTAMRAGQLVKIPDIGLLEIMNALEVRPVQPDRPASD